MSRQTPDQLKELPGGTLIQHGPYNDRVYLMKLGKDATGNVPADLIAMAKQHGYSKIFIKVPAESSEQFTQAGYLTEASIPQLFNGAATGKFMGYYLNKVRTAEPNAAVLDKIRNQALDKRGTAIKPLDSDRFARRQCMKHDIEEMAAIYKGVFQTYPFPIDDPSYLRDSMKNQVNYFAIAKDGDLISLASAEVDKSALNVEMTDFATLPQWRGNSLAIHLLKLMEKKMQLQGIKMAYTIARAGSIGINIIFAKQGYTYGGRLKNNTNISGNFESMNVWYKMISQEAAIK